MQWRGQQCAASKIKSFLTNNFWVFLLMIKLRIAHVFMDLTLTSHCYPIEDT
jgi:hypothetical protein